MTEEEERGEIKRELPMRTLGRIKLSEIKVAPPSPAGSSHLEDSSYFAIRKFEVKQMTYMFSCCKVAMNGEWKAKAQETCVPVAGEITRCQKFGQR